MVAVSPTGSLLIAFTTKGWLNRSMLHDFEVMDDSALAAATQGRVDVCIIGAGAAGILLATQLASQGLRILLLEAGGLDLEARSQELYHTDIVGLPYRGATQGRFRTYGGSTTRWGGQILELEDFDFEKRPHVDGSGWPFPKSTLKPYYERALQFEGLRLTERDDAKVWAGLGLSMCDLGPEFKMQYSRWCPERDFAILQRRMLEESQRLQVLYHANVTGIAMSGDRTSIDAVTVRSYSGREIRVSAAKFVLCTGAIEAVRLLLQPLDSGLAPWQRNGLLGKHYQDHIALNGIPIRELATQPVSRYFGYADFAGFCYHNKIRLSLAEQTKAKSLNVAGTIGPFDRDNANRDAAKVLLRETLRKGRRLTAAEWRKTLRYLPGIGFESASQRLLGEEPAWAKTMLTVHCEQSPLSSSSITLSDQRDELGLLRAKLKWEISPLEIHSLRNYVKKASELFASRRFAKVIAPKGFFEDDALVFSMCRDSNHHMGGARMSFDTSQGIVNPELRVHGMENLYLCSSAVFPCSGFSNPTHTLLALAVRLADHLRDEIVASGISLPEPLVPTRAIPTVHLPHCQREVTQLGFGCSYLLGPGLDRAKSLRLLDAAYDAGIRYFDTARLYGQGKCEALLGEFLRRHPDALVGTKFGLEPPHQFLRVASAAGRRVPSFGSIAKLWRGSGKVQFNAVNAEASLDRSLRFLGREEVELFLLHEPERTELVDDELLSFLENARAAGKIGNFGIGGEYSRVKELYATRRAYTPVLQFEHSIVGPALDVPEAFRVHYRTFARPAAAFGARFAADKRLCWWWSEMVGADLQEPSVLARLLLRAALDEHPNALTLFSTSSEEHIYENVSAARDEKLRDPAHRLRKLIFEDDLGVGMELYGNGG
jgi:choline dehydrogenase-like flavoprotein/aryl-alcohol dehydrogenase-like predicted oxidoreductase